MDEFASARGLGRWEVFRRERPEVRKVTEPTRCVTGAEKAANWKE